MGELTPCYGCEERYIACHAKCERYHDWLAAHEAKQTALRKKRLIEREATSHAMAAAIRRKKLRGIK